jgi:hypothetical protein
LWFIYLISMDCAQRAALADIKPAGAINIFTYLPALRALPNGYSRAQFIAFEARLSGQLWKLEILDH